jgi:hypothetical protein
MESTGKYWIPIWNILGPTCGLVLAHPKYTRAIKGKKTISGTRNGLLMFSSMTSFMGVLSHWRIYGNLEIWCGIALS